MSGASCITAGNALVLGGIDICACCGWIGRDPSCLRFSGDAVFPWAAIFFLLFVHEGKGPSPFSSLCFFRFLCDHCCKVIFPALNSTLTVRYQRFALPPQDFYEKLRLRTQSDPGSSNENSDKRGWPKQANHCRARLAAFQRAARSMSMCPK